MNMDDADFDDDDFGDFESSVAPPLPPSPPPVSTFTVNWSNLPANSPEESSTKLTHENRTELDTEDIGHCAGVAIMSAFKDMWHLNPSKSDVVMSGCIYNVSQEDPEIDDDDALLTFLWNESSIVRSLKSAASKIISRGQSVEAESETHILKEGVETLLNSLPKLNFLLNDSFTIRDDR